MLSDLSE
jgi:hypothetical protein